MLVAIHNRELTERLGRLNAASMDRRKLLGSHVSADQPSIIDDPSIKSGFYGASTVCVVFTPVNFLYGIPDAFCCAENMVLAASELGLASCIIARGEDPFDTLLGRELMKKWGIPEGWTARCFVTLATAGVIIRPLNPAKKTALRLLRDEHDVYGAASISQPNAAFGNAPLSRASGSISLR